jgi:hypothetical protein
LLFNYDNSFYSAKYIRSNAPCPWTKARRLPG